MRPTVLLLVSSLSLSLTGCCLEVSGGRDSVFRSSNSRHSDSCKCGQHHGTGRSTSSSKSSRPVRRTRPLFAGDRWNDQQFTSNGCCDFCPPSPGLCDSCGECGSPAFAGPDCSAPQPIWSPDPSCHAPVWTADPGCHAPAIPQPQFVPSEPGCQAPFGMAPPVSMHGPGCNCGQHGAHGHPAPMPHQPGSSVPAPAHHHPPGPAPHFAAPGEPVQPMPVPPAETPVPMPSPEPMPAPGPANPVEQTSWEVPVFPAIP